MPQQVVQFGPYRFFTLGDLNQERIAYIAAVKNGDAQLAAASINGQSFQFKTGASDSEMSLEEWGDALAAAYVSLGVTDYGFPTPPRSRLRF